MKTPRLVTEALILEQITRMNNLLERLCLAVEHIVPPPPDTEVEWGEVSVEDIPEVEPDTTDESEGLAQVEYENGILAMDDAQYDEFVRRTGSDPLPRIKEARRTHHAHKASDRS